jgi:4,5-DOPA dioxygenase extradiol
LLYLAGLAEGAADEIDILAHGYAYGSLSMTSYTLGLAHRDASDTQRCAPPPPPDFPPDESNI